MTNTLLYKTFKKILPILMHLYAFGLYASENPWAIINTTTDNVETKLNVNKFNQLFSNLPQVSERIKSTVDIQMPSINGEEFTFHFYETQVMEKSLKEKYKNIKSYVGYGIDNPSHRASIVTNDNMIMGMVMTESGESFFKSLNLKEDNYILQFKKKNNKKMNYSCNTKKTSNSTNRTLIDFPECMGVDDPCNPAGDELVTYRFAGILTDEITNSHADGTVEGGLTWLASMINQTNLITIRDFSFKLQIVSNNDLIIFTNDNPSPAEFKQNCGGVDDIWATINCELLEVEPVLDNIIGPGGRNATDDIRVWDYGALFDEGYPGGLAYCPGATSANLPDFYIFIHEIGHNFGSPHNAVNEDGIRTSIGGSIMHWSLFDTGAMFSTHSIEWAMNYRVDPWEDYIKGHEIVQTNNILPEVIIPESGFTIPMETPFILEGYSIPMNPEYTFNWESNESASSQYWTDIDTPDLPYFPSNEGSLFTPVHPGPHGYKRTFPNMNSILNNEYETVVPSPYTADVFLTVEKLPFASREMNMRLVVRTNNPYSGSVNHKNLKFFVTSSSGPFRITSQSDSTNWAVGNEETIIWDVANTDDPNGVNSQAVDILLSLDGSDDFNYVIANSVPNTGQYTFDVPPIPPTSSARLMVRSSDNIFFDINNGVLNIINNFIPSIALSNNLIQMELSSDSLATVSVGLTNDGEENSILNYVTEIGSDKLFDVMFDGMELPNDWIASTNAICENAGWFISQDASSNYFSIPTGDGNYIAVNDDACGSSGDGSADYLYTKNLALPDGSISLSFSRYFNDFYGQTAYVLISSDNWESHDEVLTISQQAGSNSPEWVYETIDLTDYAGKTVQIAFHSNDNGKWASGIALDDISLSVTPKWISSNSSGYVNYMQTEFINIDIDTNELDTGNYNPYIIITDIVTNERDTINFQITIDDIELNNPSDNCSLFFGDLNQDETIDVSDIILLIDCIMNASCNENENGCISDINNDESWNVVDVMALLIIVFDYDYDTIARQNLADEVKIELLNEKIMIKANGIFNGIQLLTKNNYSIINQEIPNGWELFQGEKGLMILNLTNESNINEMVINYEGDIEIVEHMAVNLYGNIIPSNIVGIPSQFSLNQNFPNPFNPSTTISYDLPEKSFVNLTIYNIIGNKIRTLIDFEQDIGNKLVVWDSKDDFGNSVSAGIYLYSIKTNNFLESKKMVLLK